MKHTPMLELYSRRGMPDPNPDEYVYDEIPEPVRGNVYNVIRNTLKDYGDEILRSVLSSSCEELYEAYGRPYQKNSLERSLNFDSEFMDLLLGLDIPIQFIDFIDIIGNEVYGIFRTRGVDVPTKVIDAFEKLNGHFRIHKFGYRFINGRIVRFDQTEVYDKITKPAFEILYNNEFKGAEDELGKAYKDYGKGKNKDAIHKANNAFESTMKVICQGMEYEGYKGDETAKALVNILKTNNFIPSYLDTNLSAAYNILSHGLPTVRNKRGAHGQGETITDAEDEFVQFALNSAATNIIFLVRLYEMYKGK